MRHDDWFDLEEQEPDILPITREDEWTLAKACIVAGFFTASLIAAGLAAYHLG